jgi:DNA-binding winged helix-turn-helix (wHTH) protein
MKLGPRLLLRVFTLLTVVCLFGPVQALASLSCKVAHAVTDTVTGFNFDGNSNRLEDPSRLQSSEEARETSIRDGFVIQNGEIKLNPETQVVEWRGRVAKLPPLPYLILEALILADGLLVRAAEFESEGWRHATARGKDWTKYTYGVNWVSVNMMRLKKILNENFDSSMAERIVGFHGRGFAWTTDQMLMEAKKYDPNKLTYLWDKQRVFKGSTEIVLSLTTSLVVDRYVNNHFQMLSRETWQEIWRRTYGGQLSYNALSAIMMRANKELVAVLGTNSRVLPKAGEHGRSSWRLDPNFFDLESMSRPVRNSALSMEASPE